MADSVTVKYRVQYAIGGDYQTLPLAVDFGNAQSWVSTTPTRHKQIRESIPTGGTTFGQSDFTTIALVLIYNEDSTNFVTATWTSASVNNSQKIPAGTPFLIPQADIANIVLTANTAACTCTMIIFGT